MNRTSCVRWRECQGENIKCSISFAPAQAVSFSAANSTARNDAERAADCISVSMHGNGRNVMTEGSGLSPHPAELNNSKFFSRVEAFVQSNEGGLDLALGNRSTGLECSLVDGVLLQSHNVGDRHPARAAVSTGMHSAAAAYRGGGREMRGPAVAVAIAAVFVGKAPAGVHHHMAECCVAGGNGTDGDQDGNRVDENDVMCSLLRPGGSPRLPMEDGWVASGADLRAASAAGISTISDHSTGDTGDWWPGSLSRSGVRHDDSSLEKGSTNPESSSYAFGTDGKELPRLTTSRRREPPMMVSRHRACQLGYTESAPVHAKPAAAPDASTVADMALAFLRAPDTVAKKWPQVVGGTLSAPPRAKLAAAATVTTLGVLEKPLLLPIVPLVTDCESATWDSKLSGESEALAAPGQQDGFGYDCGRHYVAPMPTLMPAAGERPTAELASTFPVLHETLGPVAHSDLAIDTHCIAAAAARRPADVLSGTLITEPAFTRVRALTGRGFILREDSFGSTLANGLSLLLRELEVGDGANSEAATLVMREHDHGPVPSANVNMTAAGAAVDAAKLRNKKEAYPGHSRVFSLLTCFIGH